MVLKGYESTTSVARYSQLNEAIKDSETVWKERLAKHALRAIEIDGNVNRDPDFLMNTPLTQIQYEYNKKIGRSNNAPVSSSELYIPPKEFTQPIQKKEEKPKIGPRLTGKANYNIKIT